MTHPTTEPSIRERLEDIASLAHEEGDRADPWPQVLDAILNELQEPSDEMLFAGYQAYAEDLGDVSLTGQEKVANILRAVNKVMER